MSTYVQKFYSNLFFAHLQHSLLTLFTIFSGVHHTLSSTQGELQLCRFSPKMKNFTSTMFNHLSKQKLQQMLLFNLLFKVLIV